MVENLEEAKKLVKLYRNFKVADIKCKSFEDGTFSVAHNLTGYGNVATCSLCIPINVKCEKCLYSINISEKNNVFYCTKGDNIHTYFNIEEATTPKELKKAFRDRANHIEKLIKTIENEK